MVVGNTKAHRFRIRRDGDPRTPENSLQLRVRSSAGCHLSVVDVDSEGGVHLLFPNPLSEAKGYLPGGRIEADQPALIPDSLAEGNRAGFFIDYAPPAGTDTVRAFCSPDPETARMLRETIAKLGSGRAQATRGPGSRAPVSQALAGELRERLSSLTSRGVRLVADTPKPPEPAASAPAAPAVPVVDWAAASITVQVEE
jgi:hypothetical protein